MTISTRHTVAVENFKRLETVHEVQRFLSLANYFRKFIRDFALKARPLQNLLKKETVFDFDQTCVEAFNALKRELASYPVLRCYVAN